MKRCYQTNIDQPCGELTRLQASFRQAGPCGKIRFVTGRGLPRRAG